MPVIGSGTFIVKNASLFTISGAANWVDSNGVHHFDNTGLPAGFNWAFPDDTFTVGNAVTGTFGWVISQIPGHCQLILTGFLGGTYDIQGAPAGFQPTTNLKATTVGSMNLLNPSDSVTILYGSWTVTFNGPSSSSPPISIPDGTLWSLIETASKQINGVSATSLNNPGSNQSGDNIVTGNYSILEWWWIQPDADQCGNVQNHPHLATSSSPTVPPASPPGMWQLLDPNNPLNAQPTVVVDSVEPNYGTIAGGTAVTLKGNGFGDGATVMFGSVAATSVVVVDHYTITCVTPAEGASTVNVVVTNTDGTHN